jgi:hypothetical protein
MPYVLPIEEPDMSDGGGNGGEAEAVTECKEHAEADFAVLTISVQVKLKPVVHDRLDVVAAAVGHEQVRGEDGERLGAVQVEPPVRCRHDHVDEEHVAKEDVGGSEEGRDEGAEEEGGDGGPVEREGAEAEAAHARPQLLRRHRLGEDQAHPRDGRQRRKEVARHGVPNEAAGEHHQEEFGTRDLARGCGGFVLLVHCPGSKNEDTRDQSPLILAVISKGMYSGETPKQFSKHMRQLRDSIVQWSVYKRSLLINTELNVFV